MFSMAIPQSEPELVQLNQFLAQHRVVHLEKRLVERDGVPYWVFLVEYAGAGNGNRGAVSSRSVSANVPDYRDRFKEPAELRLFYRLKDERKRLATAAGVDLFVVFSNEQLAQMVERKVVTLEAMGEIEQIGEARLKRYGGAMLAVLQKFIRNGAVLLEAASDGASPDAGDAPQEKVPSVENSP